MRPEAIIEKVRQAVAEGGSQGIASAELAQQYAELCAQANKRLANCGHCLKQGMVSEALRIEASEPQLLDLCAELDFIGVEEWARLCQDRNWPEPEHLDSGAIQGINEAFCSGQMLEPLLKEYRRAVRASATRECLLLLRRLAAVDKNNANWADDLKGFEQKRWHELRKEFEQAKKDECIDAMAGLLIEINGEWTTPRDERLRKEVKDACHLLYAKQAFAKGVEITRAISKAYAALNYEQLGDALGAFDCLLADGYLTPDAPMQAQVDEAREWFMIEKKRRGEERLYAETLSRLRHAVEDGNPSELEDILNVLSRFEHAIPDRLEDRAKTLMEGYQLARERRRKRILVSGIIVSLLLLAGIVSYLAKIRYDKEVVSITAELEKRFDAEDVTAFSAVITRTEQNKPRVFKNAEVQKWVHRTGELDAIVEKKRLVFEAAMTRLDAIRKSGFEQDARVVERLLEEARINAKPGAEEGRLANFVSEWEAKKREMQAKIDAKALEAIVAIEEQFMHLENTESKDQTLAARKLNDLKTSLSKASASFGQVSEAVAIRSAALESRLEVWGKKIEGKEQQMEAIRMAGSLDKYLEALETYVRAFPSDNLTKSLGRVIERAALYRQINESPKACGERNVFWASDAKAQMEWSDLAQERWPAVKDQLLSLEMDKRYTDLWECDTVDGPFFVEGRPNVIYDSLGQRTYAGMFYKPKSDDLQPNFKDGTFPNSRIRSRKLMAHCDFVKGLISLARFASPEKAVDLLLEKMSELATNNEIPPLLRLRLMDMLAGQVESMTGENVITGWSEMRAELQSVPAELHWLCNRHRDVVLGNEKSEQILKKWFANGRIIDQTRLIAEIRKCALQRGIRWVGAADTVDPSKCRWVVSEKPQEVWVVRQIDGLPRMVIVQTEIQGVTKKYGELLPGEPLFAPSDKKTTREILISLKKKYPIKNTTDLHWPAAWPDNLKN
ncbi:MAG: hypothetical protein EOM20_06485 [Spartobacteria bacterium]|nr:hypothetical protein [Spartobacteria bacterium]